MAVDVVEAPPTFVRTVVEELFQHGALIPSSSDDYSVLSSLLAANLHLIVLQSAGLPNFLDSAPGKVRVLCCCMWPMGTH
eukprot:SAG25_NODE_1110_length_3937_cov_1.792079_3_plen_80_part_00